MAAKKTTSLSSAKQKKNKGLPAILAAIAAVAVAALIAFLPRYLEMAPTENVIGGPFQLVDQNGHTVSDTDFRGKLMLIYFGYTFCPDVCPTALGQVAQAMDMLTPKEQEQVVPIFITIDPERDTVEQMGPYVAAFHPSLIGLTGAPDTIAKVAKEFKVYGKKNGTGKDYTVDHSSIIYLMGRDGKYVSHFTHGSAPKDIADGLRKAM